MLLGYKDNRDVTGCSREYNLQNICESIYDKTKTPKFTDIDKVKEVANMQLA